MSEDIVPALETLCVKPGVVVDYRDVLGHRSNDGAAERDDVYGHRPSDSTLSGRSWDKVRRAAIRVVPPSIRI